MSSLPRNATETERSKDKNRTQVYKSFLRKGWILKPKPATLEKHGLTEYWESLTKEREPEAPFLQQNNSSSSSPGEKPHCCDDPKVLSSTRRRRSSK
jgi:hypothetical protein